MSTTKRIVGTAAIPVLTFVILEIICLAHGENVITNMKGFDNFVVYTAIVMITTIALSNKLCSSWRRKRKCGTDVGDHDCGRGSTWAGIGTDLYIFKNPANHYFSWCYLDI